MGRMATVLMVIVAWLGCSSPAVAQSKPAQPLVDVSGTWTGEIKTPVSNSPIGISFKLEQTPKGLTGVAWPGPGEVPIKNVTREGEKLSFEISGGSVVYRFSLTASADRLEGEAYANDSGSTWSGKATLKKEKAPQK